MISALSIALLLGGGLVVAAAAVGLLRFPDATARLHALTTAENLGLGLVLTGLALRADSVAAALKLLLIWVVVLATSATTAQLVAGRARGRVGSRGAR